MPVRIAFRVIEASSEDEGFKALELNIQKPTAEGWRSRSGSAFPQHVTLELEKEVLIKKIQVLSHHCMIAQHIDVFVGKTIKYDKQNSEEIIYTELGRVHLANRKSNKVRELKSIYVKAVGRFVKLVFSEAHKDELNSQGQVSLVAVNIFGEAIFDEAGTNDTKVVDPSVSTVPDQYSPLDDLSFLIYQDALVIHVIKQLEILKKGGAEESRNVGSLISELEKTGKQLVMLEMARKRATQAEDLRKFSKKIEEMTNVVRNKVKHLRIDTVLPERIQSTLVKIVDSQLATQPSVVVPQDQPKPSTPKTPFTPKALPVKEIQSPDWLTTPPTETPRSNAYCDYDERPLPTHRKGQESRSSEVVKDNEELKRDSESVLSDKVEDLSEKEEKDAEYIIEVFGMTTAKEIFSRKWNYKLQGLESISEILSTACDDGKLHINDANDNSNNNNNNVNQSVLKNISKQMLINIVKAMEQAVLRVSRDNILSVFKTLLSVYRNFLLKFVPSHNSSMPKLDSFLQHTLPPLLSRLGEISSRPREMTSSFILELLRSSEFKYKNVLVSVCFKMNKPGVAPKVVLGVTEIIFTIYLEKGMKDSGLTWDCLLNHLNDAASNSCSNVRKFTRDFLARVYEDLRTSAEKEDQPGSRSAKIARVKNLLLEFDSVDNKPKGETAVATRSDENPKINSRKSSLVNSGGQKPLVQNQVNKHTENEKIVKRCILEKPLKIPKENLPSQKPSSVFGSEHNPKRQNAASKVNLKKISPHRRSLPTVKMPKVVPAVTKRPAVAQTRRLPPKNQQEQQQTFSKGQQQQQTISKGQQQQQTVSKGQQQHQHSEDEKSKRRSFSLDRKEIEKSIDRPVVMDEPKSQIHMSVCVFCGKEGVINRDDVLDRHYLTECPMLIYCEHCKKRVEVSDLNDHRVKFCPRKELFKQCPRCRQAVLEDSFEGHFAANTCKGLGDHEELCPICGSTVRTLPNDNKYWVAHLTQPGLCCPTSRAEPNC